MTQTLLGEGRSSEVYAQNVGGHSFAVKKIRSKRKALDEAEVLRGLSHSNIVKFEGLAESSEDNSVSLYLELLNQNLWDFILEKGKQVLSYRVFLHITLQVASALEYLHANLVVHHDLKPHDILVNDNFLTKLCDFGSSVQMKDVFFLADGLGKGTTPYCAPEIFLMQKYDYKIDIYSFGVVMWCMLTGRAPFDDILRFPFMISSIKEGNWFREEFPQTCLDGSHYHPKLIELISRCLNVNPAERPTASQLLMSLQELTKLETEVLC